MPPSPSFAIAAAGQDPDKCIGEFDTLVDRAKAVCAKQHLERAKAEVAAWRSGKGRVVDFDREAVRARFDSIRAQDPELASKMMMAARKGESISDRDLERLLEGSRQTLFGNRSLGSGGAGVEDFAKTLPRL
jgi:hypothetical protein